MRVMAMVFEGGPEDLGQHSVMLALADNSDEGGLAWPGNALLARKSRLSERQVTRVLAALEDGGWLTIRRRVRGLRRRCSEYQLNLGLLRGMAEARERDEISASNSRTDTVSCGARKAAETKATCKPPTDMVSSGGDEPPEWNHEQTLATPRADMTLADVVLNQRDAFHNHHRTTIEPPETPPTPSQARGSCVSSSAEFLASKGVTVTAEARLDAQLVMQAVRVKLACDSTNPRLEPVIHEALRQHCTKTKCSAEAAGEMAIANVGTYRSDSALLRFKWNWIKFFRDGYWLGTGWPYDHDMLKDLRRHRDASVGRAPN